MPWICLSLVEKRRGRVCNCANGRKALREGVMSELYGTHYQGAGRFSGVSCYPSRSREEKQQHLHTTLTFSHGKQPKQKGPSSVLGRLFFYKPIIIRCLHNIIQS